MSTVSVNPPKTPVTKGSQGVAAATIPNVCKMPGPPAPFVPAPLPNIGKSGMSPKDYSKDVTFDGNAVGIKGSTFESMGDIASKGTGGGLISANTHGITKFVGPGSMDVKVEGKNVQLLSDPMLNNCGPSGSPPNAATLAGIIQATGLVAYVSDDPCPLCGKTHASLEESRATKADGQSVVAAMKRERLRLATMVGIVHCKHKHKYADHSGVTVREFVVLARDSGYHTRPGVVDGISDRAAFSRNGVRDRYERNVPYQYLATFRRKWARANARFLASKNAPVIDMAYPPGQCAGQKTILLALDSGARPSAMTEKWYHHRGHSTGPNRHLRRFRDGRQHYETRYFEHGQSVPPCATCALILPLLMCPGDEERDCTGHTPPGTDSHPRPEVAPPAAPAGGGAPAA